MFRNQLDPNESGRPCYSNSFDCLLSIAKGYIFHPPTSPLLDELRRHWQEINNDISFREDLNQGVELFSQDLARAINYLNSPATLIVDPEEPGEIPAALQVLDEAVILDDFLQSAADTLSPALPDSVRRQCHTMVLEMTVEHMPPCHRLIPLNKWRLKTRKSIPKASQYLFAWYDLWTAVPDNTITEIINHWASIIEDNDVSWLDIEQGQAKVLLQHIKADAPYRKVIESSARLHEKTRETLAESIPLGLMALENSIGLDNPAPDIAVKMGYQAAACAVVGSRIASEQDRHEKILLAAFFGPDLENRERLDLLKKVSTWLASLPETSYGSLARYLQVWCNDRLTGRTLLDESVKMWSELLEQAAVSMPEPVEYCTGAFHRAVEDLLRMGIDTVPDQVDEKGSILDTVSGWQEALRAKRPTARRLEGIGVIESILQTAFPRPFAMSAADSCGAECLYIGVERETIDRVEKIRIERLKCSHQDDRLMITGKIAFLPNTEYPDEFACGLIVNDELLHPHAFIVTPGTNEFEAVFLVDEAVEGELRIVLVHKS